MNGKRKALSIACLLLCMYGIWVGACKQQIHQMPEEEKTDISKYERVQQMDELSEADFEIIFQQTGVTKLGMETLVKNHQTYLLGDIQEHFYETPQMKTERVNVVCHQELMAEETASDTRFIVEDGDMIITLASYLGGWRYGHCGLVLDADEGTVLEAITYGEPSCKMHISHWSEYPAYVILRPKNVSEEEKQQMIDYASSDLMDIRYDLLSFKTKNSSGPIKRTHCSHLVWYAYHYLGLDLDKDGTPIVTPYDIVHDDDLELVQVYGMCLEGK